MPRAIPSQSVIWGIDPSSSRFALCIRELHSDATYLHTIDVEGPMPGRLALLHDTIAGRGEAWIRERGFPVLVAIEKPYGSGRNETLVHAYGAIVAALASIAFVWTPEVAWLEVESSKWKKGVGLPHNADADVYCTVLRREHPEVHFDNHDEAAAYWIATYAKGRITID